MVRVCFVCSGNICRSPTAQVVLNRLAAQAGLADAVHADSAGIGDWHVGDEMDERSRRTLARAGYAVPAHIAKQFRAPDFDSYDVVVALDGGHRRALRELAGETAEPQAARDKVVMLRAFDPDLAPGDEPDVADPYYGGARGFTDVLDQVERSCAGLLTELVSQQTESPPR